MPQPSDLRGEVLARMERYGTRSPPAEARRSLREHMDEAKLAAGASAAGRRHWLRVALARRG